MVFWSSFSKKIKQAVSQISFDALKRKVETIESDYATKTYTDQQNQAQDTKIASNTSNITNNSNNINTLDTKVDGVISGLQNGNIVNYAGTWNSTTTFKLAQAVTHNGDWFVSTQNNNRNNQPSRTSSTYWVYISAPTVDLTPYLTKTSAASTYSTITTTNGIDTRLRTAEQKLETNSTNIVNLEKTKAAKSYVDNNFYNKQYIDRRRVKYQDITITNVVRNRNLIQNELWITQFETNFQPPSYDYLVNNIIFYDILFLHAQYTNWKHKITAAYTSGSPAKLAIEMLYTEQPTVKLEVGQTVRIWYSEEINR